MLVEGPDRDYWGDLEFDKDLGIRECLEDFVFTMENVPGVMRILMNSTPPLMEIYWTERDTFYFKYVDSTRKK